MKNKDAFWMIYVEGGGSPTYKHTTWESVETEAKRLAKQLPGKKVYILGSVVSYQVNEFIIEDCKADDLPF